jgi:genome maintenance exonuclease 1
MFDYIKPRYVTIAHQRHLSFDGAVYPSVTTILAATKSEKDRQALQQWRKRLGYQQAQKISTNAARRGTSIHSAIKDYLRQKPLPEDITANPFWHSIQPVLARLDRVYLVESAIYHPQDGYAGCFDCLGEWQGELCVFDWKTASKPKKREWITDYFLQITAYIAAINSLYQVNITQGIIAIALSNEPAQMFTLNTNDIDYYQAQFLTRLNLWQNQQSD